MRNRLAARIAVSLWARLKLDDCAGTFQIDDAIADSASAADGSRLRQTKALLDCIAKDDKIIKLNEPIVLANDAKRKLWVFCGHCTANL
jgi:hypothetical protein